MIYCLRVLANIQYTLCTVILINSNWAWQATQSWTCCFYLHLAMQVHSRMVMQGINHRRTRSIKHACLFASTACIPKVLCFGQNGTLSMGGFTDKPGECQHCQRCDRLRSSQWQAWSWTLTAQLCIVFNEHMSNSQRIIHPLHVQTHDIHTALTLYVLLNLEWHLLSLTANIRLKASAATKTDLTLLSSYAAESDAFVLSLKLYHIHSWTTTTTTTVLRPPGLCRDYPGKLVPERKNHEGKTNLDLLEQERVSGSGISWAIGPCKSAPYPR